MNYLADVPEVIELCRLTKQRLPRSLTCVGGHSASFTARELLEHAAGAIDCVVRGEGEEAAPKSSRRGATTRRRSTGSTTSPPWTVKGRRRCRSIRSTICGPRAICCPTGSATSSACSTPPHRRRRIKKRYYLETRGDVLLRNKELFKRWKKLGLEYMFLGLEALDAEGLKSFRKRISLGKSFEALEYARSLGIMVAVNIIADTDLDEDRFRVIREWALSVPEIVNLTVNTPYPGTETFLTNAGNLTSRDYRLFDIQHAVLPTRLPLHRFYEELVKTQQVLNRKHLGLAALKATAAISAKLLLRGQTNFVRMLWKFNSVYDPRRQLADHAQPVKYEMKLPRPSANGAKPDARRLYVLPATSKAAQTSAAIAAAAEGD